VRLVQQVNGGQLASRWIHGGAGFWENTEERFLEEHTYEIYIQVAGVGDYKAIHWLVGADTLDIRCLARGVYTATPARRRRPCYEEERSGRAARRASKPRAQHIIRATVLEQKGW
jgi:hypothetical protein